MKLFKKLGTLLLSTLALSGLLTMIATASSVKININSASVDMIDKNLIFVGHKTAQAIVDYRKSNGNFKNLSDLIKVEAVSKRLAKYNKRRIGF